MAACDDRRPARGHGPRSNLRRAATAALVLAVGSLAPAVAHAVTGSTVYVDSAPGSGCSGAAAGTEADPFCTIQAAVNVATTAGDTVVVEPGYYDETVTVTSSGTAAAPISILGYGGVHTLESSNDIEVGGRSEVPTFTISGASYVDISGFDSVTYGGQEALVENSSHITLDTLWDKEGIDDSGPAVHITGSSSYVTVSRNILWTRDHTASVQIDPGSSHDVITTNDLEGESGGFVVNGAPDTDVTSNTIAVACNEGIDLTGASTGSTIENNAVWLVDDQSTNQYCPPSTATREEIEVDADSIQGTKLDYNTLYTRYPGVTPYIWDGTDYSSASSLYAATGQGAHDTNADSQTNPVIQADPQLIDSADANAPGELGTDLWGDPRVDDPDVANTGTGAETYYDRGAVEVEDPITANVSLSDEVSTAPATVTADESLPTAGWTAADSWTLDFGDGSPTITTTSPADMSHTYSKPGTYTVTVTATDATWSSTATSTESVLSSSVFHPVPPARLLDTRDGTGTGGVKAPLKAGDSLALQIEGDGPIPATGVSAVALNVTVTNGTAAGFLSAYADGSSRPTTSNLNFAAGQTLPAQVIAPVGADGKIDLYNGGAGGATDVVADVAGYFGVGAGLSFSPDGPKRILDTRNGTGGTRTPIAPKSSFKLTAANVGGYLLIPGQTVALNVTVTNAKSNGFLTVYPGGTSPPGTSSLNFAAGQTVANAVLVQVGSDGSIEFQNAGTGSVDVVADLLGAFAPSPDGFGYTPINPERLLDTRDGIDVAKAPMAPGGSLQVTVAGAGDLPYDLYGVDANVTVTQPTKNGDLVVFPPYGSSVPIASTLDFGPDQTVSNNTLMGTMDTGRIEVANQSAGSTELIIDVFGYFGAT